MRQIFESFISVGIPAAALVSFALVLARREDHDGRDLTGKTKPANRQSPGTPIVINANLDGPRPLRN
jgi:hypothetical protein